MIIEFWKTGLHPITCYGSNTIRKESVRVPKKRSVKKPSGTKQPITVKSAKGDKAYESIALCAAELKINANTIYSMLNGRKKNEGEYQFFKSKINQ